MATTTRGYPIFGGGMAPAGPVQMQVLAEAIDADVGQLADDVAPLLQVTETVLTPSNTSLYGALGGGFQVPAMRRTGKERELIGLLSNAQSISFGAGATYAIFQLAAGDRPLSAQIFSVATAGGLPGAVTVRANGVIDFTLGNAVNNAPTGTWYLSLSGISWRVP